MDDIIIDVFTDDRQIPTEKLVTVCKYRQGSECCRYVYFPAQKREFFCVKKISELQEKIDEVVIELTAQGDNCPGLP